MLISQAFAWNNPASTGSSGGARVLTIILAVGITVLLVHVVQKKWRRRRQLRRVGSGE
jgi:hypothetical protein